jgi:hypothetical protein
MALHQRLLNVPERQVEINPQSNNYFQDSMQSITAYRTIGTLFCKSLRTHRLYLRELKVRCVRVSL